MKLRNTKRWLTLSLAVLMALSLVACTMNDNGSDGDKEPSAVGGDTLFTEPTEISIVIGSHSSWPYDENFLFWEYFREATGATINVTSIPNTEYGTKLSLLMASPNELPDMIHMLDKPSVDRYASSGAFIAIDDYIENMPNYTKFWESIPEEDREAFLMQRLSADGKTYAPQVYGFERVMNLRTWMYRKDIFEKNNLTPPETFDDMYETAKKLKEIYPDSYPVCLRTGLAQFDIIGPSFKPYFAVHSYYDFPNEKWSYGATEPVMKEIVEYFIKLRNDNLIPPDFMTINSKSWEELVSMDRGFMMPEYMVRFDFFNLPNRERDPNYTWAIMSPPYSQNGVGGPKLAKSNVDQTGYVVCNTGNDKRIENSIKLLDWMYSDEATELLSWGKEGETFEIVDGKRRFLVDEGVNPSAKFGTHTYGLYQRLDPDAVTIAYSDEQASMTEAALNNLVTNPNPVNWLALNAEESSIATDLIDTLKTYSEEQISKFILGQQPMSQWDAFQTELKSMGIEDLLAVYESAYARARK